MIVESPTLALFAGAAPALLVVPGPAVLGIRALLTRVEDGGSAPRRACGTIFIGLGLVAAVSGSRKT